MPSSRGSSQPRDRTCISCGSCISGGFLSLTHQESSPRPHTSEVSLECNYNKYPKCRKIWVYYSTCNCSYYNSTEKSLLDVAAAAAAAKSLQLCPTLCDSIDGSPPGSPIPGILQARTLEWVAISFSNACK